MARVNNLSNFLTDVANAIKTKKGSETAIPAASFDTEILALPSQGTYEQRVLNISANGTQTITPSSGYDAIDELELTVAVPEKQLQSKTYNFTQNTNIQLLPDSGYDGFDTVTLNINVPSSQINNQDKTITQNGTYTADSGYTGLGEVTVNVPGEEINNQDKTVTQNGTYTADSGYTGLGTVIVNVPQTGGQTQLKYEKATTVEKCEGATYGFTLNSSTNKYTYSSNNTTVAASRFWFWSDGVTPFIVTGSCSYPNESRLYTVLSKVDTPINLTRTHTGADVQQCYDAGYETKQINVNYGVVPVGLHFIDIKHYNQWSESSSSTSSIDNIFPAIDKTINVFATKNITEMQAISALADDICVVYDEENLVYSYDGTNWNRITAPNDAIKLFSSITEMNNTEGMYNENAVVYGEDWGNFIRPTSSTTTYVDVAFKVSGTYQYTGDGTPAPMEITSNTTSKQYMLWAYGDEDEMGDLWEYEEYAPTEQNTMNLLVLKSWSVERVIHYTSTDGINYTTTDIQEPLVVEQAGVNSYMDEYKSSMLLGKVPAFYGMFTYRTGIKPELFQGKPFNYANDTTISTVNLKKLIDITCDWLETHPEDDTTVVSPLVVGSSVVVTTSDFVTYKLYKELLAYDQTSKAFINSLFVQPNNDINFFAEYYLAYDKTHLQYTCLTVNTQTGTVTRENGIANGVEVTYSPSTSSTETKTGHIYNAVTNGDWITSLTLNKSTYKNESRSTSISSKRANGVGGSTSFVTVTGEQWWPADTQLSVLKTSDLYNGVTAYGHDGIVSGDNSWQNNITDMIKLQNYMPNVITSTTYGISNNGKHCLFGDITIRTEDHNTTPTKAITKYIAEDSAITDEHIIFARLNNSFNKNALYSPDGNWKITFSTTSTVLTINITNMNTNITNTHTISRNNGLSVNTANFHVNNDFLAVVYTTANNILGVSKITFATNTLVSTTISHTFGTSPSDGRIYYHKKYNTFYATFEYPFGGNNYGGTLFRIVDNGSSLSGTRLVTNTWSNTFSYNCVRFAPDGTVYYFYGGNDACWGKKINGSTGSIITSYSFGDNEGLMLSEKQTIYSLPRILENNDGFVIGSTLYSKSSGATITNTNNYYYPNTTDINEYYGVTMSPYGLPEEYEVDDWNGTSCIIYDCNTNTKCTLYANICLPVGVVDNVVITGGETIENVSVSADNIDIIFFNNHSYISNVFGITATITSATEATYENSTHLIVPSAVFRNGLYSQYIISPVNNNLEEVTNGENE